MREHSTKRTRSAAWAIAAFLLMALPWLVLAKSAAAAPGNLSFESCLRDEALVPCLGQPGIGLEGPEDAVVSPDGRSV
jgi:hypothetical protein